MHLCQFQVHMRTQLKLTMSSSSPHGRHLHGVVRTASLLAGRRHWGCMQDVKEDMGRVLEASQRTHWAAMLLDSSLSRTRRMKGLVMLLFCEHWSIRGATQGDTDVVQSICESNGIALLRQVRLNVHAEGEKVSRKRRKAKHHKEHKKRRRREERGSSDSDFVTDLSDTGDIIDTTLHPQHAGVVWDLAFGPYKVTSALGDIPEQILSICACIRFEAYVKACG